MKTLVIAAAVCAAATAALAHDAKERPIRAVAGIEARSGSQVKGLATFTEKDGKVTLVLSVEGLEPGPHAFHLHEKGDCSAPDATSAGAHWNPTGAAHGKWGGASFHHGDVGNLVAGADGKATLTFTTELWEIGSKDEHDVVGKALIIHAKPDDFTTQPTGNAGGRIGCGVILPEWKTVKK